MMSSSEKDVSMQKVEEETNELRRKYPLYTAILERIPDMDLKEGSYFQVHTHCRH